MINAFTNLIKRADIPLKFPKNLKVSQKSNWPALPGTSGVVRRGKRRGGDSPLPGEKGGKGIPLSISGKSGKLNPTNAVRMH